MSAWLLVKENPPKEDGRWYEVRVGEKELGYTCKYWESPKGGGYFINAGFEKELEVTHYRPRD